MLSAILLVFFQTKINNSVSLKFKVKIIGETVDDSKKGAEIMVPLK